MSEAVVTLPQPLAPGSSLDLTALYSGAIPPSGERLERIGAPADQAGLFVIAVTPKPAKTAPAADDPDQLDMFGEAGQ